MAAPMLTTIQNQINFYGYTIVLIFGSIGNVFILILFNRQRHNACSIYLVNSAMTNLLYLLAGFFFNAPYVSYNNESLGELILCKLSIYTIGSLGQVTKTILILVCIDRYLITSHRVNLRTLSTTKRAKYLVFFTYIFWSIAGSHQAIFLMIIDGRCIGDTSYTTFYTVYSILFLGFIPSSILIIFGCLTRRNLRQLRRRVRPVGQNADNGYHIFQRRDRDLLVLVFVEVIVYIITAALFPGVFVEVTIRDYILPPKSLDYFLAEMFTINLAVFLLYIFSAAPFYIYIASSASFRHEFRQLMVTIYWKLQKQIVDQPIPQANGRKIQQEARV